MSVKAAPDQQINETTKIGLSLASEQCGPQLKSRWKANDSL